MQDLNDLVGCICTPFHLYEIVLFLPLLGLDLSSVLAMFSLLVSWESYIITRTCVLLVQTLALPKTWHI